MMLGKGKELGYSVAIAEFVPRLLFFKAVDLKRDLCVCACVYKVLGRWTEIRKLH